MSSLELGQWEAWQRNREGEEGGQCICFFGFLPPGTPIPGHSSCWATLTLHYLLWVLVLVSSPSSAVLGSEPPLAGLLHSACTSGSPFIDLSPATFNMNQLVHDGPGLKHPPVQQPVCLIFIEKMERVEH